MPGAAKLLSAYKLKSVATKLGLSYAATGKEEYEISRNHKYSYKYELKLTSKSGNVEHSAASVKSAFVAAVKNDKVVNSEYGNPYHCHLTVTSVTKSGNGFRVKISGHSERIYNAHE